MSDSEPSPYVRGATYARRERPRFEYKPSATNYSGGGYPRVRSNEYREWTPGEGSDSVFVSIHRLAAVAWHLPDGTLGEDVHLSDMDGMDVHHIEAGTDDRGMPAANGEAWTELVSHNRHAEITQTQRLTWAKDQKRAVERDGADDPDRCPACGEEREASVSVDGTAGLCLACGTERAKQTGETIEL